MFKSVANTSNNLSEYVEIIKILCSFPFFKKRVRKRRNILTHFEYAFAVNNVEIFCYSQKGQGDNFCRNIKTGFSQNHALSAHKNGTSRLKSIRIRGE